jgi:hypothetical protein
MSSLLKSLGFSHITRILSGILWRENRGWCGSFNSAGLHFCSRNLYSCQKDWADFSGVLKREHKTCCGTFTLGHYCSHNLYSCQNDWADFSGILKREHKTWFWTFTLWTIIAHLTSTLVKMTEQISVGSWSESTKLAAELSLSGPLLLI